MSRLSPERTEYATTLLINLIHIRGLNQAQLREMSGISQSQLSLITSRKRPPTKEQLETLFQALGILLRDVIAEADDVPEFVYGYFATPLTGFVQDGLTRMMTGSFLNTTDIRFSGTAETGFTFDKDELLDGLKNVRHLYFRHRALFRRINDADFAVRLQRLIDDRMVQDRTQF